MRDTTSVIPNAARNIGAATSPPPPAVLQPARSSPLYLKSGVQMVLKRPPHGRPIPPGSSRDRGRAGVAVRSAPPVSPNSCQSPWSSYRARLGVGRSGLHFDLDHQGG